MGFLDWLFRRGPARPAVEGSAQAARSEKLAPASTPRRAAAPCPHCGSTLVQARPDGRCVACAKPLPAELRAATTTATKPASGSRGPGRIKMPRPANVRELGTNSPLVAFDQGGMMVVMDRDAFDYTYGDADGPDPAQRDLD